MPTFLLATLDTKGHEAAFLNHSLKSLGLETILVDTSCLGDPQVPPDVSSRQLFDSAGLDWAGLRQKADRGQSVTAATTAARHFIQQQHAAGRVDALIAIGGSAGTTIATAAMRELPIGLPKLMVSTLASGNVRPWVADKDILMLNSIVDLAGINRISRQILSTAAAAISGMVHARKTPPAPQSDRPIIAATMFGVTTPCVQQARAILEQAGYEVLVFHATGNGGQAMESLIADGLINAVLDITTTELADELVGGILSAGPDRLTAAGKRGIPQLISVGALDMVNFGPPDTIPAKFQHRKFHKHNPTVTLMRTTPEENFTLGQQIAQKAAAAKGPTSILFPSRGVSAIDAAGQSFDDPAARQSLLNGLQSLPSSVPLIIRDEHINDPTFATFAAQTLLGLLAKLPATAAR